MLPLGHEQGRTVAADAEQCLVAAHGSARVHLREANGTASPAWRPEGVAGSARKPSRSKARKAGAESPRRRPRGTASESAFMEATAL